MIRVFVRVRFRLSFLLALAVCLVGALSAFRFLKFPKSINPFSFQSSEAVYLALERAPFTVEVPAFGVLQTASATSISVPQVQTGGLKIFRIVRNGSRVRTGETLVEFDATELIRQAEETQNSLETTLRQLDVTVLHGTIEADRMVADREIATMELERAKTQAPKDTRLFSRNEITEGELDIGLSLTRLRELGGMLDSQTKMERTSQNILVIEQRQHSDRLGVLRQSLGSLKILAPTDGLVLHETVNPSKNRQLNAGDTVWPGQVLLTMPDFSRIEARVYVLESDGGGLAVGQKASVTVDSHPTVAFDAHLTNVDLRARQLYNDSPVKYFEARLDVHGISGDVLKPGKSIRARILVSDLKDVIVVPRSAVIEETPRFFVWVKRPGGLEKREVAVAPADVARLVLPSGVTAGELVLLNPPKPQTTSKNDVRANLPLPSRMEPPK